MGNCKNCYNWENHGTDFNTCGYVGDTDYKKKIDDSEFALFAESYDDTGLMVMLRTGPMFGCIHFKDKEI
jgi:hypothetical protein